MCQSTEIEDKFLNHGVPMTSEEFDESLYGELCDAHCHPHDDLENLALIPKLKTGHITIMGVRQDDWDTVSKSAKECNSSDSSIQKCIPCFGVHPWFSHFLMTQQEAVEEHYKSILNSSNTEELQDMIDSLTNNATTFKYDTWYNNLRSRLLDHPEALVGEVGVDRAARLLPGGSVKWQGVKPTSVQCSIEHQIAIFDIQCTLARELNRGMSVHCVQGQGHLFNYLKAQSNQYSSRKVKQFKVIPNMLRMCLHSYGGSTGSIKQFLELKGFQIFVSFSVGINARLTPANKLQELIRAVPEDRLLIESDLNTPKGIDPCMMEITKIVAEARQWSIKQVVQITSRNWVNFVNNQDKIPVK
jgi:Tat protein secretion system quality control protein TatD with DNase activity